MQLPAARVGGLGADVGEVTRPARAVELDQVQGRGPRQRPAPLAGGPRDAGRAQLQAAAAAVGGEEQGLGGHHPPSRRHDPANGLGRRGQTRPFGRRPPGRGRQRRREQPEPQRRRAGRPPPPRAPSCPGDEEPADADRDRGRQHQPVIFVMELAGQEHQGRRGGTAPDQPQASGRSDSPQARKRQGRAQRRERPDEQIPPEVRVRRATEQGRRPQDPQPDRPGIGRGPRPAPLGQQRRRVRIPDKRGDQGGQREDDLPRAPRRRQDDDRRDQDVRRRDLQRQTRGQQEPGRRPAKPPAPGIGCVPEAQGGELSAEHCRVRLEGPAVADRHRQQGERGDRRQRDGGSLPPAHQAEEAPGPQGRRQRRGQPPGGLQVAGQGAPQPDDQPGIDRGLDQEQVRERPGVELRAEPPRAPVEVAGHHRRRDLPPNVVLDDRLAHARGSQGERGQQQDGHGEPSRREVQDRAPNRGTETGGDRRGS